MVVGGVVKVVNGTTLDYVVTNAYRSRAKIGLRLSSHRRESLRDFLFNLNYYWYVTYNILCNDNNDSNDILGFSSWKYSRMEKPGSPSLSSRLLSIIGYKSRNALSLQFATIYLFIAASPFGERLCGAPSPDPDAPTGSPDTGIRVQIYLI